LNIEQGGGIAFPDGVLKSSLGITGPIGPQGIQGETGPKGDKGDIGDPGTSGGQFPWVVVNGNTEQASSNTGYLIKAQTQPTITLPASPSVGDILKVVGVSDGGWSLAQNPGQFVTIRSTSTITPSFVPNSNIRLNSWTYLASSSDGTKLVAVGPDGIFTSVDSGATWVIRDSTSRSWQAIASSGDGTKLVAAVYGGQIYTSVDSGATWVPRDSQREWVSIASSSDGVKLVAAVVNGLIYTSNDSGVTWVPRDSSRGWVSVASSSDGAKLVAVVYCGYSGACSGYGDSIFTSTDSGVTWVPQIVPLDDYSSVASSSDGSKLVSVAFGLNSSGQIYTSSDSGVTWEAKGNSRNWVSVASSCDGTKLVAVSNNTVFAKSGNLFISQNSGASWKQMDKLRDWVSVASSCDGKKLVASAKNDHIYTYDYKIKLPLAGDGYSSIDLIYVGNGEFTELSHTGIISNQ
jgi:hypothetical protein